MYSDAFEQKASVVIFFGQDSLFLFDKPNPLEVKGGSRIGHADTFPVL